MNLWKNGNERSFRPELVLKGKLKVKPENPVEPLAFHVVCQVRIYQNCYEPVPEAFAKESSIKAYELWYLMDAYRHQLLKMLKSCLSLFQNINDFHEKLH